MKVFDLVRPGETVEVVVGSLSARTKVEDIFEDGLLTVQQPTYRLVPLIFDPNEEAMFLVFRENDALYSFRATYIRRETVNDMHSCLFQIISDVERDQRRYSYRLPINLEGKVRRRDRLPKESAPDPSILSVNLSDNGLLFHSKVAFDQGAIIVVELQLSQADSITLSGKVLRCTPPEKSGEPYEIAIQFVNMLKREQERVTKFILNRQIIERRLRPDRGQ